MGIRLTNTSAGSGLQSQKNSSSIQPIKPRDQTPSKCQPVSLEDRTSFPRQIFALVAQASQPPDLPAYAQKMRELLIEHGAQNNDAFQNMGRLTLGLQTIEPTSEQIMLELHQSHDLMQPCVQLLQSRVPVRGQGQAMRIVGHENPLDRTVGICEHPAMTYEAPRHRLMQKHTFIRLYIQAYFRLNTDISGSGCLHGPITPPKAPPHG